MYRVSSIEYRVSIIECRASSVERRASSIEHRVSNIILVSYGIVDPTALAACNALDSPNWNCSLSMRRMEAGAHRCKGHHRTEVKVEMRPNAEQRGTSSHGITPAPPVPRRKPKFVLVSINSEAILAKISTVGESNLAKRDFT